MPSNFQPEPDPRPEFIVLPPVATGATAPWTSLAAAAAIDPYRGTIAKRVLYWHRKYRESGLIDDELRILMQSTIQTDSSHRKRRTELSQVHYLEDSGLCRLNRAGNPEAVWRVTELGLSGPWPIRKPKDPKAPKGVKVRLKFPKAMNSGVEVDLIFSDAQR